MIWCRKFSWKASVDCSIAHPVVVRTVFTLVCCGVLKILSQHFRFCHQASTLAFDRQINLNVRWITFDISIFFKERKLDVINGYIRPKVSLTQLTHDDLLRSENYHQKG